MAPPPRTTHRAPCRRAPVEQTHSFKRRRPVRGWLPSPPPMPSTEDPIVIVPYDPRWPGDFLAIAAVFRLELGEAAERIDHVGSTAVPGLPAKDVIDIQIAVHDLNAAEGVSIPVQALGYVLHAANADRTKRFFREPPGCRRTHVHVRARGSFDEQLNLLLRDFLRADPVAAQVYAATKRALAERFRYDRAGYVTAKEPTIWGLLLQAHSWSQTVGWSAPARDA